jgi:hypothetical protein
MDILAISLVLIFIASVLALVGYTLFELSPLARHADRYRNPETGRRLPGAPRLD